MYYACERRAACELRTAALLLQIRNALGRSDTENAWKQCVACPALLSAFKVALSRGQALTRARLQEQPSDDETLFLLGKLDLNYVWLQLGTLGHKTGWNEYWEARRRSTRCSPGSPGTYERESREAGSTTASTPRCRE